MILERYGTQLCVSGGVGEWTWARLAWVVGLALCLGPGSRPAAAQEEDERGGRRKLPPLPAMACPLMAPEQAPQLDGVLDEPVWSKADLQTRFYRYYFGLERPQDFGLLTDGEWLYIGFTAYEPEIAEENQESVSLAIAPHKTSDQFVAFSVTMTAQGITKCNPPSGQGEAGAWQAVFRQYPDRWVAELAVPAAPVFGDALQKGKVFDFNLSRSRSPLVDEGTGIDIYQQWSNTGTSSGTRYRFGEVMVGNPADRLPAIRAELRRELEIVRGQADELSAESRQHLAQVEQEAEGLLAAGPDAGALNTAAVKEYEREAQTLRRRLQRAALAEREVLIWTCNPMTVPMPADLPAADQPDAARLDIRVLAGEWESAALVVTNLTAGTLDGQVLLTDFTADDGTNKAAGWDVLQVRTAPLYLPNSLIKKRDPLPRLQEGDLFRVAPEENELLWLTFKSHGLAPGRYTATLTVRSLDDQVSRNIELVLRVYPLALGAEGRPWVNPWHFMVRGKDLAQRRAHCRDYYINVGQIYNTGVLPLFAADAEGNLLNDRLEASSFDRYLDEFLPIGADLWLIVVYGLQNRLLAQWNEAAGNGSEIELWSPQFNEIFGRWVVAFRDHLAAKGLPPDRWAFYIRDEPAPGEWRQEVIQFARVVEQTAPEVQTYITLQVGSGDDPQKVEVSKYVDILQIIGEGKPEVMAQIRANAEVWGYSILLRSSSPKSYRRGCCWEFLRRGDLGTGFWIWEGVPGGEGYPMNIWGEERHNFTAVYAHHDGTPIPSLRTEAFREGIEDWKYVIMLDEALAAAKEKGVDAAVVSAAEAYRARCLDELTDADSAYRFRDAARSHLLALHTALGDVDAKVVKAIETD